LLLLKGHCGVKKLIFTYSLSEITYKNRNGEDVGTARLTRTVEQVRRADMWRPIAAQPSYKWHAHMVIGEAIILSKAWAAG